MLYYVDDIDGSLWVYDLEEYAKPGLRGPLTQAEVYAIQNPPLTPEQVMANNQNALENLSYIATSKMLPHLLLAINLGEATDAETLAAKEWQAYLRSLVSVDLSPNSPEWPVPPN